MTPLFILLLDPDSERRTALAARLEAAGHRVVAGPDASGLDFDARPDLVVLAASAAAGDRERLRARLPDVPTVVLEGETALAVVEAEPGADTTALAPRAAARRLLPPLLGRDEELADLVASFALGVRVLTLLGPHGVGKTALAGDVAARTRGAVFCDLGFADSAADVVDALAEALDVPLDGVDAAAVGRILAARGGGLVVLDEVDGVGEALATLLGEWRRVAPDIRFLLTARAPMDLQNERCVELSPLAEPHAIALVAQRARSRGTAWAGDPVSLGAVARAFQGLPLALELAASWDRLEDALGSGGNGDPLRAALGGTWSLLSDDERRTVCQLSVFRGGFDLAAASAVRGSGAGDLVEALVHRALLRSAPGPGPLRYQMHEAVRAWAIEQSSSWVIDRARARYALHFLEEGRRRAREGDDPDSIEAARADRHHSRTATRLLADPSPAHAAVLLLAQQPLWENHGASAADLDLLHRAAEESSGAPALRAGLLAALAIALGRAGRWREAEVRAAHALSASGVVLGAGHPLLHTAEDLLAGHPSPTETRLAVRLVRLALSLAYSAPDDGRTA